MIKEGADGGKPSGTNAHLRFCRDCTEQNDERGYNDDTGIFTHEPGRAREESVADRFLPRDRTVHDLVEASKTDFLDAREVLTSRTGTRTILSTPVLRGLRVIEVCRFAPCMLGVVSND
jgi:hypothetical protein